METQKDNSFIQEIIDSLKSAATEIEIRWGAFKKGELDKSTFEELYNQVLAGWLSELDSEKYSPNGGCKYKKTNPECDYFIKMDV